MVVYIELVLFDNFVIDYILLYVTARTLNMSIKKLRLSLGAFLGAVLAAVMPIIMFAEPIMLVIKIAAGAIIVLIGCAKGTFKKYLLCYLLFICYTFAAGGAIIGIILLFNGDIYSAATLNYNFGVPAGVICAAVFFVASVMVKTVKYIGRQKNIYP